MNLPPDSHGFFSNPFKKTWIWPFQMLFSSPDLSFLFFSKKREI